MHNLINKVLISIIIAFKKSFAYIGNFILDYLGYMVSLIIQLIFWKAVYVAGMNVQYANVSINTTVIAGYSISDMFLYILVIYLITSCNAVVEINDQIKEDIIYGDINIKLIQPINYILYRWCLTISKQFFSILLSILICTIYINCLGLNIDINVFAIIEVSVFILLALCISFLLSTIIGLLSFWIYETGAISVICSIVAQFLSGSLIPLEYFGEGMDNIFQFFPFAYMAYFPAQIILKRVSMMEIFRGGVIAVFWVVTMGIIALNLWKKGIRKYSAFGG